MTVHATRRTRSDGERSRRTILRAAASLATVDGLDGISIGNLAAHIGMSKSGLYAHFRSKEELQLETVRTAREIFDEEVLAPIAGIDDPLERLKALCASFLDHVERRVFPGGCFFASAETEFAAHPGPVRDKLVVIQRSWTQNIVALIADAQARGEIRADEDPTHLAFELNSFMLLGNTMFVLHDDPAFLDHARTAIARRLDHAA